MVRYNYENEMKLSPADLAGMIERLQIDLRIVRERNLRTLGEIKNFLNLGQEPRK